MTTRTSPSDNRGSKGAPEPKHEVRMAQLIYAYGPGAMVDFPEQTLMTAAPAPESWQGFEEPIEDLRLSEALGVRLVGPNLKTTEDLNLKTIRRCPPSVGYVRFPKWFFCPKCHKFQPWDKWVEDEENGEEQINKVAMTHYCEVTHQDERLRQPRFVVICEKGHLDDFPWREWVHQCPTEDLPEACREAPLRYSTTSNHGLAGLVISCSHEGCGKSRTMDGATTPGSLRFLRNKQGCICTGHHFWKDEKGSACHSEHLTVVPRGSASIYFPNVISSLTLPHPLAKIVKGLNRLGASTLEKLRKEPLEEKTFDKITGRLEESLGAEPDEGLLREAIALWKRLDNAQTGSLPPGKTALRPEDLDYRYDEFKYLCNPDASDIQDDDVLKCQRVDNFGDYQAECEPLQDCCSLTLVHRLRVVKVMKTFTRLRPLDPDDPTDSLPSEGEGKDGHAPIQASPVDVLNYGKFKSLPAYEMRGEGIFLRFNDTKIESWARSLQPHQMKAFLKNFNSSRQKKRFPAIQNEVDLAKFVFLHTLAHLLIREMSFMCGYNVTSLAERIYCSTAAHNRMAGILIYTASGDSEGSLGGLVRLGQLDCFPTIFARAVESGRSCSNDPLCGISEGQGRDGLNHAACHACTLLPETSCEWSNILLDRALVGVDLPAKHTLGFACRNRSADVLEDVTPPPPPEVPAEEVAVGAPAREEVIPNAQACSETFWEAFPRLAYKSFRTVLEREKAKLLACDAPLVTPLVHVNDAFEFTPTLLWKRQRVIVLTQDKAKNLTLQQPDFRDLLRQAAWHVVEVPPSAPNPEKDVMTLIQALETTHG